MGPEAAKPGPETERSHFPYAFLANLPDGIKAQGQNPTDPNFKLDRPCIPVIDKADSVALIRCSTSQSIQHVFMSDFPYDAELKRFTSLKISASALVSVLVRIPPAGLIYSDAPRRHTWLSQDGRFWKY